MWTALKKQRNVATAFCAASAGRVEQMVTDREDDMEVVESQGGRRRE